MHELLTPAQCYEADRLTVAAGLGLGELIEQAGLAVAQEITRRYGARPTIALCGPGNNGKDGMTAAAYLKKWGWPVEIVNDETADLSGAGLIIDALYGAGLSRDFSSHWAAKIKASGAIVVAIDVPSGLDGTTGQVRGACAGADLTITFFRKKPGHLLEPGRSLCGEQVLAQIGISAQVLSLIKPQLWENARPARQPLPADLYKFSRGSVLVMSGPELATGAARMAATAALGIGAGLVTLLAEPEAAKIQATHLTAIMLAQVTSVAELNQHLSDKRVSALCIGPAAGLTPETIERVKLFLGAGPRCLLDADALTCFAKNPSELFDLIHQKPQRDVVMTPHHGEFARLFPDLSQSVQAKYDKAIQAARRSGAIIVYKGSDTVIAHPDGRAVINSNAPPSLATAGSGDVLSGLITGLLAQGQDGFAAACAGVWYHGALAEQHGVSGLTAESLLATLMTRNVTK